MKILVFLALAPLGHAPQNPIFLLTSLVFVTGFETHFQICSGTMSSGHGARAEHHKMPYIPTQLNKGAAA